MTRSPSNPLFLAKAADGSPLSVLEGASERDWETGAVLVKALDLWCDQQRTPGAALFARCDDGTWDLVSVSSGAGDGDDLSPSRAERGERVASVTLPGSFLLRYVTDGGAAAKVASELGLLIVASARLHRLHERLKGQIFQENYRVVTLEALYDVGLSIASTLDLERLCDEILLRAVSLLDARRGALYLLDQDRYCLHRTIGGTARRRSRSPSPASRPCSAADPTAIGRFGAAARLEPPARGTDRGRAAEPGHPRRGRQGEPAWRRSLPRRRPAHAFDVRQPGGDRARERVPAPAGAREGASRARDGAGRGDPERLLPSACPRFPGSRSSAGTGRPARSEATTTTSSRCSGGRIGLVVADVTGKGMPAALLVSTLHSAIRLLLDARRRRPTTRSASAQPAHRPNRPAPTSSSPCSSSRWIRRRDRVALPECRPQPGSLAARLGRGGVFEAGGLPLGLLRQRHLQLATGRARRRATCSVSTATASPSACRPPTRSSARSGCSSTSRLGNSRRSQRSCTVSSARSPSSLPAGRRPTIKPWSSRA